MGESLVEVGHDSSDCGVGCIPSERPRNNETLHSALLGWRTQARTKDGASDVMTHHVVEQKVNLAAMEVFVGSYHLQYEKTCSNVISWRSRKKKSMALSSSEVEYIAIEYIATAEAACEAVWWRRLLKDLQLEQRADKNILR
ncbi:hypothetical protein RHSIM_Rhsim08G0114600 [Rhododendron simsii]|uniref:Uncharacterized protein n=1 Tax=Rhododendron simsii TaxID=118357 RepID=A0A834LHH7_RHOSS|nr:hypothetical protein RHSIM_Rhsim08G0114600 [Rhododendron simsii]